ncbi:MAG: hypothetical protein V2B19_12640 [Pseudomonadota bacterium]
MKLWKYFLFSLVAVVLMASGAFADRAPLTLDLRPDDQNPSAPTVGDHLKFWSTITNVGVSSIEGVVAWISLVEIDPGNEQPVNLEDWSARKAITGATLGPGKSLKTDWPVRLIKGGDYRVVVSVTGRGSREVFTSSTIQFHVQEKPVLETKRGLPVPAGVPPFLILVWLIVNEAGHGRK